jgi:hypothetical protein
MKSANHPVPQLPLPLRPRLPTRLRVLPKGNSPNFPTPTLIIVTTTTTTPLLPSPRSSQATVDVSVKLYKRSPTQQELLRRPPPPPPHFLPLLLLLVLPSRPT